MSQRTRLLIANKERTLGQLDVAITRLHETRVGLYREVIGKVFRRILLHTPQFSGAAVAHWTIGVNAPAPFYDPSLGRRDLALARTYAGETKPLAMGNPYWIEVAWNREKPKIDRLRREDKVFISNGVLGDADGGKSMELYMESLQDPAYWRQKLRDVNQPYEVVYDSVAHVLGQHWKQGIDPFRVYVPDYGVDK